MTSSRSRIPISWRPSTRVASTLALGAAVAVPIAVAAALTHWRDTVSGATVAVVLAGVVVAISTTGRRSAAIVGAIVATMAYDWFFTVPYGSFTIHQQDELITAGTLLVVGLLAAEVQTRSLRRRDQVEEGSNEISRIGAVTDLVAAGKPAEEIIRIVELELKDLLYLRSIRWDADPGDGQVARIERTGEVSYGALRWRADRQGLPGPEVELPVFALGRPGGRYVMVPEPGLPISFDRRIVAVALADQVGATLAMHLLV